MNFPGWVGVTGLCGNTTNNKTDSAQPAKLAPRFDLAELGKVVLF